jgi:hypothetical protein
MTSYWPFFSEHKSMCKKKVIPIRLSMHPSITLPSFNLRRAATFFTMLKAKSLQIRIFNFLQTVMALGRM